MEIDHAKSLAESRRILEQAKTELKIDLQELISAACAEWQKKWGQVIPLVTAATSLHHSYGGTKRLAVIDVTVEIEDVESAHIWHTMHNPSKEPNIPHDILERIRPSDRPE